MAASPAAAEQQERIEQCQGLVRSLASRIHRSVPSQFELDDLVAYGQLGLVAASREFDPSRGCRFSTYAYYRIRGAIYDGLAKMAWGSRAAYSQARYEQMSNHYLEDQSDESAGPANASVESGARWLRNVTGALAVVYLAAHGGLRDEADGGGLVDGSEPAPPSVAIDRETSQRLHALIDALPPQAATLIRATYFEGLTLEEAGRRLGVSKSWASRLHARALEQLARGLQHTRGPSILD